MPRYLFDVNDGRAGGDDAGIDLADLTAARARAAKIAGEALVNGAAGFWDGQPWSVRVSNDAGLALFELHLTAISSPATLDEIKAAPEPRR